MKLLTCRGNNLTGLGSEHLETCVKCGRRFNLLDVHLDGDGLFRCTQDSYGPNPRSVAEANRLLTDYLARQPKLVARIEHYNRRQNEPVREQSPPPAQSIFSHSF
jgi:hypothetical protein